MKQSSEDCEACRKGIPLENGKHRQGLPGGYPDYFPCPYRQEKEQKAVADYLIKGE